MPFDKDSEDELPVELGPVSNGEYEPPVPSAAVRDAQRRARDRCEIDARRLGMTRRAFLRTSMATAAVLLALDACSDEQQRTRGRNSGGRYRLPPESTTESTAARDALGGTEAIVDVQTHFLDFAAHPGALNFGAGFPQARCGEADSRDCFSIDHFLELLFLESDTNVGVISAIPVAGDANPLTTADMERARRIADTLCRDQRLLIQGQALPALGRLPAQLAAMDELRSGHSIGAWKIYTHAPGPGWFLDDHDASAPQVGHAFLEKVMAIGPRIVSVHKGLSGGNRYASPVDIGPAARSFPEIGFVVYHSGYEGTASEGPYNPDGTGVDRLVRSLADAAVGAGANVYAELGSTWFNVMRDPNEAAHTLGKLLTAVGPDRVLWGTDTMWYGTPQPQIEAFRAFEITSEYQDRFGYPALTPETKRKILGANAAALYGVTPPETKCAFSRDDLAHAREALPARAASYGPRTATAMRALARDHRWVGF